MQSTNRRQNVTSPNQSINQPNKKPRNQSINQSSRTIDIDQSINRSRSHSINQSSRTINVNQSINQSIEWSPFKGNGKTSRQKPWGKGKSHTVSRAISWTSLTMKIMSKRDKMVGINSMLLSPRESSHRPKTLLAAARTEHREFSVVVMPALAIEMVCCSMASWMATRSSSRILSNSSMHTTPPSASTIAPPSMAKLFCKTKKVNRFKVNCNIRNILLKNWDKRIRIGPWPIPDDVPINQSMNQSIERHLSIKPHQSINQSIERQINQTPSIDQSINLSINHSNNQSIDRKANQSKPQSLINQSIERGRMHSMNQKNLEQLNQWIPKLDL